MRIVSVNVGLPRPVTWNGKTTLTGVFKEPVTGRVALRGVNLEGDAQADLTVHGGVSKAVYAYPLEHYGHWRSAYPGKEMPYGMLGENLTLTGLDEESVCVGDRLRMGTAELVVTEPRMPCFKLGIRFGDQSMVKRFVDSRLSGFYLSVHTEGEVEAGDEVVVVQRDPRAVSIREVLRLYLDDKDNVEAMRRALTIDALPGMWRKAFRERVAAAEGAIVDFQGE